MEQQTKTKDISKVGEIDHVKSEDILYRVKELINKEWVLVNGKHVLMNALNEVKHDDDVVVAIHRSINGDESDQQVFSSEMNFVKMLGILEFAKQISQQEE